jgi:hypothetical protein
MAKKIPAKTAPAAKAAPIETGIKATAVRNSPLPKAEPKIGVTHDMIAKRAYEIFVSGKGGSQDDNWSRAERELRGL